jgi:hypothetical protein
MIHYQEDNMRKINFLSGILAIMLIFGLIAVGCGDEDTNGTSEIFKGTDLAGNKYELTISNSARAVSTEDNYELTIEISGGETVTTTGTINEVIQGNTFVLSGGGAEVTVSGENISSLVGEIALPGGQNFLVRTFETVYLRAHRYDTNEANGENWNSHFSILLSDIFTGTFDDFLDVLDGSGKGTFRISGNTDSRIQWAAIEFGHWDNATGTYTWLGGGSGFYTDVSAGDFDTTTTFWKNAGLTMNSIEDLGPGEVIVQIINQIRVTIPDAPEQGFDSGTTIPSDVPENAIMATLRNFKIEPVQEFGEIILGEFNWDNSNSDHVRGWTFNSNTIKKIGNGNYKYFVIGLDEASISAAGGLAGIGIMLQSEASGQNTHDQAFPWYYEEDNDEQNGWITYEDLIGEYGAGVNEGIIYLQYDLTTHPSYAAFKTSMATAEWANFGLHVFKAWENAETWHPISIALLREE